MLTEHSAPPRAHAVAGRAFYRPELDCLRFVAFLLVLIFHAVPFTPAAYGRWTGSSHLQLLWSRFFFTFSFSLPVFFALSAYLIGTLLLREREATGTVSLRDFYVRRVLRIWPLYLFGLVLGLVLPLSGHTPDPHPFWVFGSYLLIAGNWYCSWFGFPRGAVGPLWSISVEEQFYLVIPTVARAGGRKAITRTAVLLLVLCVSAIAVLSALHVSHRYSFWANSFVQFGSFAGGLLLSVHLDRNRDVEASRLKKYLLLFGSVGLFFLATLGFHTMDDVPPPFLNLAAGYLCVSAASAMLVYAFVARRWRPARSFTYLGKISFGLYVYHMMFLEGCRQVLGHFHIAHKDTPGYALILVATVLPMTILAASISYRWLESPFLRMKHRFEKVKTRPV